MVEFAFKKLKALLGPRDSAITKREPLAPRVDYDRTAPEHSTAEKHK
jgi:hypothetical protein